MLTLGNAVCGFAAIACASKIAITPANPNDSANVSYFFYSGWLILAAMLFDVLDGLVARLSRTATDFGGQLDSLCDAISFGAAPAFLLLRLGQDWQRLDQPVIGKGVAVIAAIYLACAVLRLARFNIENAAEQTGAKRFKGLPSPAAAGCLASLAILRTDLVGPLLADPDAMHAFVRIATPLGALIVALLMVSRLAYPHFTRQLLRGRRQLGFIVQLLLVAGIVVLAPQLLVF